MEVQKTKRRLVSSSAALISIGIHVALVLLAGGVVALKFYKQKNTLIQTENQKPKLERRKLQMPVKTQPFVEQMSKPTLKTTRITANSPQMVNIPETGEYVKMAPMPSFKSGYTNFVQMDRTLEFNSKYRDVSHGISSMDFFGTRGKAEKVVIVVDTSKAMLYDERGGAGSYEMVRNNLREVVGRMRPATLFNVVLFDDEKVGLFKPSLVAASPAAKTNVLSWVEGINTNLAVVGLTTDQVNFTPRRSYDIPMADEDLSGWLKGFRAAAELKPEIIFVLSAEWGNVSAREGGISYFMRKAAFEEYQKKRAKFFMQDDYVREKMDEYMTDFNQLRASALRMLQLENQSRMAAQMAPKVVRDWDDILFENDVELPPPPYPGDEDFGMSVVETRYTIDEVLQSLFVMAMDNYRHLGFPKMNFVMLKAKGGRANSAEASSGLTSEVKFKALAKAVGGRFRFLEGMPQVDNRLKQDVDDIVDILRRENPNGF